MRLWDREKPEEEIWINCHFSFGRHEWLHPSGFQAEHTFDLVRGY